MQPLPVVASANSTAGHATPLRHREDQRRLFEAQVRRYPRSSEAYSNLGSFMWREYRDYPACVAAYTKCLEITPNHVEALNQLALVHKNRNKLDQAEALFRRAISVRPSFCRARRNLATLLRERGAADEALQLLLETVALDPHDARGWALLGEWQLDAGRSEEALHAYTRCTAIDMQNSVGFEGLARLYALPGRLHHAGFARIYAQTAVAVYAYPDNFVALAAIISSLFRDHKEAARILRVALASVHLKAAHRLKLMDALRKICEGNNLPPPPEITISDGPPTLVSESELGPLVLTTPLGTSVDVAHIVRTGLDTGVTDSRSRSLWEPTGTRRSWRLSSGSGTAAPTSSALPPARCTAGHAMWLVRHKPYATGNTWSCDVCAFGIDSMDALHEGVYHCSECEVDVCNRCRKLWEKQYASFKLPDNILQQSAASKRIVAAWEYISDGTSDVVNTLEFAVGTAETPDSHTWCTWKQQGSEFTLLTDRKARLSNPKAGEHTRPLVQCMSTFAAAHSDIPNQSGLHEVFALRIARKIFLDALTERKAKSVAKHSAVIISAGRVLLGPNASRLLVANGTDGTTANQVDIEAYLLVDDDGMATNGKSLGGRGDLLFMPPEVILGSYSYTVPIESNADDESVLARDATLVWSTGALLAALLTGSQPYLGLPLRLDDPTAPHNSTGVTCVQMFSFVALAQHHGVAPFTVEWLAPFVSTKTRALLREVFDRVPSHRPSVDRLIELFRDAIDNNSETETLDRYVLRTSATADDVLHGRVAKKEAVVTLLETHAIAAGLHMPSKATWVETAAGPRARGPSQHADALPAEPLNVGCLWIALARTLPLRPGSSPSSGVINLRLKGSDGDTRHAVEPFVGDRIACLRQAALALSGSTLNRSFPGFGSSRNPSSRSPVPTSPTSARLPQHSGFVTPDVLQLKSSPFSPQPVQSGVFEPVTETTSGSAGTASPKDTHTLLAHVPTRRVMMNALKSVEEALIKDAQRMNTHTVAPANVDWPHHTTLLLTFFTSEFAPLAQLLRDGVVKVPMHPRAAPTRSLLRSLFDRIVAQESSGDVAGAADPGACFVRHTEVTALCRGLTKFDDATLASVNIDWHFAPPNLRPLLVDGLGGLMDPDVPVPAADIVAGAHTTATDVFLVSLFAAWLLLGPDALNSAVASDGKVPLTVSITACLQNILPKTHHSFAELVGRGLSPIPGDRPSAVTIQLASHSFCDAMMDGADDGAEWETKEAFAQRIATRSCIARQTTTSLSHSVEGLCGAATGPAALRQAATTALTELLANKPMSPTGIAAHVREYANAIAAAAKAEAEQERVAAERQSILQWLQIDDGILKVLLHVEGLSDIIFYSSLLEAYGTTHAIKSNIVSRRDCDEHTGEIRYFGPVAATTAAKGGAGGKTTPPPPPSNGLATVTAGFSELRFILESSATSAESVVSAMKTYGASAAPSSIKCRFMFIHDNDLKITSTERRKGEVSFRETPEAWSHYRRLRNGRAIENYFLLPSAVLKLLSMPLNREVEHHAGIAARTEAWNFTAEMEITLMRLFAPVQPLDARDPDDLILGEGWRLPGSGSGSDDETRKLPLSFAERLVKIFIQTKEHTDMLLLLTGLCERSGARQVPDDIQLEPSTLKTMHECICDVASAGRSITSSGGADQLLDARARGRFVTDTRVARQFPRLATWAATVLSDASVIFDRSAQEEALAVAAKVAAKAAAKANGKSSKKAVASSAGPKLPALGKALPKSCAPPELLSLCRMFIARFRVALLVAHLDGLLPAMAVNVAVTGVGFTPMSFFRCPSVSERMATTGFVAGVATHESPRPLVEKGSSPEASQAARAEYCHKIKCLECGNALAKHHLVVERVVEEYRQGHSAMAIGMELGVWGLAMSYGIDSHPGLAAIHGGDATLGQQTIDVPVEDGRGEDLQWYRRFLTARAETHRHHFEHLYFRPSPAVKAQKEAAAARDASLESVHGASLSVEAPSSAARCAMAAAHPCEHCRSLLNPLAMIREAFDAGAKGRADDTVFSVIASEFEAIVAPLHERRQAELEDIAKRVLAACAW
jgi:Tfp pilus assembly protein PilF